ncbi:nickel pincer cofactor biosynthesis protein LarC [Streptomyces sp. NPDC006872]|uniref:nickel pincer cofactor biosynthesis protein LarC n=1 Tax=Streptomyces sp. NPDC006872 TaxID=3155720 RepID=UPI0033E7FC71
MSAPTHAWFDCSAGAAGDMLLGALLDAGASLTVVREAVEAVAPGSVRLRVESVRRCGFAATKAHVDTVADPPHRTWRSIRALLTKASLPEPVRDRAQSVFASLARAEAAVHGVAAEEVHFHEVGALDAIADVVGVCAAFHDLGIATATATPLVLGSGRTRAAHGELSVPAPAVLRLLADHGAPAESGRFPQEMCTPTGAALVLSLCSAWGQMPSLHVRGTGTGAGTRDLPDVANVVRVVLGTVPQDTKDTADATHATHAMHATAAVVVEANVDDLDPRLWPQVLARLLALGASDAWLTPILMKKGRPAHTLSVLCPPASLPAVRESMVRETSTIGTREHPVGKTELARETRKVDVDGVPVRVKIARLRGHVVNVQPEYEDVADAAQQLGVPLKTALARSIAAAEGLASGLAPDPASGLASGPATGPVQDDKRAAGR